MISILPSEYYNAVLKALEEHKAMTTASHEAALKPRTDMELPDIPKVGSKTPKPAGKKGKKRIFRKK